MRQRPISALGVCAAFVIAVIGVRATQSVPSTDPSSDQRARPTFRGGVDLIQLTVSVLDDKRQPVRGLTAADFTVLEDGVPRPIRAFTPVELPEVRQPEAPRADWTRDVVSDVATNQVSEQPGRLVVIVMDRSIHFGGDTLTARHIATAIVEALGPNDLAALVATGGNAPQNFTADRKRLIASIAQRDWSTDSDVYPWDLVESLGDGRCLCGLCVLDTVTRIAEAVREATGRAKSLFFIGQGMIVQAGLNAPKADPGCDRLVRDARIKMLGAIAASGLIVHSIDPSSLRTLYPEARVGGEGPLPPGVAAVIRRQKFQKTVNDVLAQQGTLHVLPDLTGGRTVINRNVPEDTVPDIFRESQSYYVLAIEASTSKRGDARRSIEVKVRRRDVKVSAQRAYAPPDDVAELRGSTSAVTVDDALRGLLPDGRPPLTMVASAFASPDGSKAEVAIDVDAQGFLRRDATSIPLQVSAIAVDQTGRSVASAQQTSTVVRSSAASSETSAVDLHTHLDLAPGDYEIRTAVRDVTTDTSASVFSQIVVPAFAHAPLSLSDVVWYAASSAPERGGDTQLAATATRRTFGRTEIVRADLQVYQAVASTDAIVPVTVHVRIVDTSGRTVRDQSLTLDAAQFTNRRADCRLAIPIDHLTVGEYLLRIEATAGKATATKAVRFSVRS